jgi:Flp pilus assembly protein TadB
VLENAMKFLLVGAALLLSLAVISNERVRALHHAALLKADASRQASMAFTADFQGHHQDAELKLLDERRALATSALRWNVTASISFALSLLLLFAAWVVKQLARAAGEAEPEPGSTRKP